jgi:hypothetical protein
VQYFFRLCLVISVTLLPSRAQSDSLSLLFIGDIMGHDTQINAAWDSASGTYDYSRNFQYLVPIFKASDFVIANLEVTLAGKPFKGYPQFSSPDALAAAAKNAGIDIMVTANNHSCDRGKKGILRTLKVLDKIRLGRCGTYPDSSQMATDTPYIFAANGITLAMLNYTYGTNGLPVPAPTVVNLIDSTRIMADVKLAREAEVDKVIVFLHWGFEYEAQPRASQIKLAQQILRAGADLIIGSHPHVVQKTIWQKDADQLVIYSLGNFVSNQRQPGTDGGQMLRVVLRRHGDDVVIANAGYVLTWVHRPKVAGNYQFFILPAANFYTRSDFFKHKGDHLTLMTFVNNSRKLLNKNNLNTPEYIFTNNLWQTVDKD